ncbi:hypothetical protein [Nonomuraea sp. CA-141351]|uniref:hypothetical protein n=1 Tax=Nonomuraea sp. CA-141351 TaxID=3239996 RepID=UPI003D8ADB77
MTETVEPQFTRRVVPKTALNRQSGSGCSRRARHPRRAVAVVSRGHQVLAKRYGYARKDRRNPVEAARNRVLHRVAREGAQHGGEVIKPHAAL